MDRHFLEGIGVKLQVAQRKGMGKMSQAWALDSIV
jgi:hypothetical protein